MSEKDAAREFLLEEYKAFSASMATNEQTGETRVNWLIGLCTAVAGGLGATAFSDHAPDRESMQWMMVIASVFLFIFGTLTYIRIKKRDAVTDHMQDRLARIREIFKHELDPLGALAAWEPFPPKRRYRTFGGLGDLVLAINGCLLAAGAGAALAGSGAKIAFAASAFVIALAFPLQRKFHKWIELRVKKGNPQPTHAGAVIYRLKQATHEFLLIGPRKLDSDEWLLPKGHIEKGETASAAAEREVLEETGVIGRLEGSLGTTQFDLPKEQVRTTFYLLRATQSTTPEETRRMQWVPFDEAYHRLSFPDQRKILAEAARRLSNAHPPGA